MLLAAGLSLLLSAAATSSPAADFIATSCVAPDGALTTRPGGRTISPYFANLSALGLAVSQQHLDVVLRWLGWYVDHEHGSMTGIDGVVDDATIDPAGAITSRRNPDSTDAYGATFLMLARAASQSGDPEISKFLVNHKKEIRTIAESVTATQQANGLTWARPGHKVFYAIDNEQVFAGLVDGSALFANVLGDRAYASLLERRASAVRSGLRTLLWDDTSKAFYAYMNERGRLAKPFDAAKSYPDGLAQVLAVAYRVVPAGSPEATHLLAIASPAMSAVQGDEIEQRYAYLYARRVNGDTVPPEPFAPTSICASAGWYLLAMEPP